MVMFITLMRTVIRVVRMLLLAVYAYAHACAENAAGFRTFKRYAYKVGENGRNFIGERSLIVDKLKKRRAYHIARRAHSAFEIKSSHWIPSVLFIMLAMYPAPNPLSMLTTLTPLAQELSIESRAATPPKLAP